MKQVFLISFFIFSIGINSAFAGNFEHETNLKLRALYGYATLDDNNQKHNHFPLFSKIDNTLGYVQSDSLSFNLHTSLQIKNSDTTENFNQGRWGEEVYASVFSDYGDFYIGQMQNAGAQLSITDSNLSVWTATPLEITDFMHNPNWQQNGKTKYYATLTSTVPNTDGSSIKFTYLTPEYKGTTLGLSITPKVNAADSLISKFASYHNNSAYSVSLYKFHEFNSAQADIYLSFSDYEHSHSEYAAGFSFYRKGWSIFASYLKTETKGSDKPITVNTQSKNQKAYFDDFRDSTAYKLGVSYEFAFLTSTLSYFDSYSKNTSATNRIINLHNSIKFDKNYALYLGLAHTDFKAVEQKNNNKGYAIYTGIEFEF